MPRHASHRETQHVAPNTPGASGSAEAMAVLLVLARHPAGLQLSELAVLAGLPTEVAAQAITGLAARARIACSGKGKASRWRTINHHMAAQQAGQT